MLRIERDRTLRDAFLAMRPLMRRGERGRFIFDDVARGRACWLQIAHAMETAAARGVPVDRLLAFPRALEAYARALTAEQSSADFPAPMSILLLQESESGAAADIAQARVFVDASPSRLHALIETCERHMMHLAELVRAARERVFVARTA